MNQEKRVGGGSAHVTFSLRWRKKRLLLLLLLLLALLAFQKKTFYIWLRTKESLFEIFVWEKLRVRK